MARPTKLTPPVAERIVKAFRAGNYAEAAARSAGIGASTYYRWLERGEAEEVGIPRDLLEEVRRAEAEAEVHAVCSSGGR
jgi:DNA invertase Pin-like site-specific DNA recombinase